MTFLQLGKEAEGAELNKHLPGEQQTMCLSSKLSKEDLEVRERGG